VAKPLVSRKGPGAGATSQMLIASAPVLNFKLSSGSFWFFIWAQAPAPDKLPSSGARDPSSVALLITTPRRQAVTQQIAKCVFSGSSLYEMNSVGKSALHHQRCVCPRKANGMKEGK